jgi:hypothetical protein
MKVVNVKKSDIMCEMNNNEPAPNVKGAMRVKETWHHLHEQNGRGKGRPKRAQGGRISIAGKGVFRNRSLQGQGEPALNEHGLVC